MIPTPCPYAPTTGTVSYQGKTYTFMDPEGTGQSNAHCTSTCLASKNLDSRCVLLSDPSTFGAGYQLPQPKHVSDPDFVIQTFNPHLIYDWGVGHMSTDAAEIQGMPMEFFRMINRSNTGNITSAEYRQFERTHVRPHCTIHTNS